MKFILQSKLFHPFAKYLGYQRCLQLDDLRIKKSDSLIKDNSEFFRNKEIQNQDSLNIDSKISSVTGWVPYIKDKTSLIVYNFFSVNYSLRKNLILQINIIKNHNIYFVRYLTLKQNEILELSRDFFKSCKIDNGLIVLKLFHPNIHKNHGGHGGAFRFWGKYFDQDQRYLSTVHSLPFGYSRFSKAQIHSRNYFPSNFKTKNKIMNVSLIKDEISHKNNLLRIGGYNLVLDENNNPYSIWHLGPAFKKSEQNIDLKINYQCFWVPKNKNINPRIVIDEKETLLNQNESQKLTIKILYNNKIIEQKEIFYKGFFEKSIKEIFGLNYQFEHIVFLEFNSRQFSYAQINYDNDFHGDQVHTHESNYILNEKEKLISVKNDLKKNCRKFMHLHLSKNYNNYLIIHNLKLKDNELKKIKIRLIANTFFEKVELFEILDNTMIKVFDINKLFEKEISSKNLKKAIVQIESEDGNFNCSLLCQNVISDKIIIDHLTGG
tara:strand:- start:578 stop:2053 length:1476 start_codon:yes stop_codon:yes gene_type:complete